MFEHLARYGRILVAGPQRSGTRIASKMIAQDTGHLCCEEEAFGVHDRGAFDRLVGQCGIVVQCPAMSHAIHEYGDAGTLVVWMVRDLGDILASERRIGWTNGPYHELMHYGYSSRQARSYRLHGGQVAPIKVRVWQETQRAQVSHWLELDYESLAGHPLWVPRAERAGFGVRQTCPA